MTKDHDLIYRQAAIAALGERPMSWVDSDYELGSRNRFDMDRFAIDTVPPVDAVQVVRCRDCKWHRFDKDNIPYCYNIDYGYGWKDDEFCSRGERKERNGNG